MIILSFIIKKNPGVWHPHDKFFYDVVKRESGVRTPIALRSLVGIVPLLACLNIKVSQLQSKSGKNIRSHLDELLQKNSPFVRYVYLLTFALWIFIKDGMKKKDKMIV